LQNTIQTTLREELLKQWAEQIKRSPPPVILSMGLIAYMASDYVSPWLWGSWFFLVLVVQGVRWSTFRALPDKTEIPVEQRLRRVENINLAGTILHSLSLFCFPLFSPYQGAVLSMLFIGLGVGSVMMSAGYAPFARAHVFFGLTPLFALWGWSGLFGPGGTTALIVTVVGAGYSAIVLRIAHQIFGLYSETFDTRIKLEYALERAEAAGRAKTRFLASASHDLRQPIHALALFSAALATRPLDENTAEIARNINASVEALSYELDGLLDISKLDAGIMAVNRNDFRLASLLRRLQQDFAPLAHARDTTIVVDCPANAMIRTDGALLERILSNLVTNAILHNAHCTVTMAAAPAGSHWRLVVADNGRGIEPSEHQNIFEEFYQLENRERDRGKGLGLGLSIVRRLSDLLELQMEFESAPGKGALFRFTVPASERGAADEPDAARADPSLASRTVLVVDDEQSVRDGMRAILEELGCKVLAADGTQAAIAAARAEKPDIALVDLRLRNRDDGLTTIDRLRELYPELPVVIISGDTAPDRLLAASTRNIPVLTKPVLLGPLKEAIAFNCRP